MEDKVLTTIRKQIKKDARTLSIDNFYLVKVTDAIRAEIEGHASEIRNLSLSGCKLNSLHNFPSLPNLRRLDLNDNNLKDEDLDTLKDLSNLKYLSLAGNKIKTIDAIKKISGNKQLKMIDMFGCPLSKSADYRDQLFNLFPKLQFVDLMNAEGEEVSYVASDDTMSEDDEDENDDFIDDDGAQKELANHQEEDEVSESNQEAIEEDEEEGESGDDEADESEVEESNNDNQQVQQSNSKGSEDDRKKQPEIGLMDSLGDQDDVNGHHNGKAFKKVRTSD